MLLLATWFPIYQFNTIYTTLITEANNIVSAGLIYYMIWVVGDNTVSWFELICLRGGFSIFGAWVTSTILVQGGVSLKWLGLDNSVLPAELNEEVLTVIALWSAFVWYEVLTYLTRNPVFGGIYLFVLIGIWHNVSSGRNAENNYKMVELHSLIIFAIHTISITSFSVYLNLERIQ